VGGGILPPSSYGGAAFSHRFLLWTPLVNTSWTPLMVLSWAPGMKHSRDPPPPSAMTLCHENLRLCFNLKVLIGYYWFLYSMTQSAIENKFNLVNWETREKYSAVVQQLWKIYPVRYCTVLYGGHCSTIWTLLRTVRDTSAEDGVAGRIKPLSTTGGGEWILIWM